MRRSRKPIVIAARRSRLARTQAEMVGRGLGKLHPAVQVEYRWVESHGDAVTDRALSELEGKGMFTAAVDAVVLAGEADLAVHSFKDVPVRATPGLALAATPRRADVRDCLIARDPAVTTVGALPGGATVGTSSPRRAAQLKRMRGDLVFRLLRGNVPTRLEKVKADGAGYDATLLAVAGLNRLGLKHEASKPIEVEAVLPAASQGAMALFCRADDHVTLTRCLPLNNAATSTAAHAERQLVEALGADCDAAIAALAEPTPPPDGEPVRNADAHWFRFRARVLVPDGSAVIDCDETVRTRELPRLVKRVAADFEQRGARDWLQRSRNAGVIGPAPDAATPRPDGSTGVSQPVTP